MCGRATPSPPLPLRPASRTLPSRGNPPRAARVAGWILARMEPRNLYCSELRARGRGSSPASPPRAGSSAATTPTASATRSSCAVPLLCLAPRRDTPPATDPRARNTRLTLTVLSARLRSARLGGSTPTATPSVAGMLRAHSAANTPGTSPRVQMRVPAAKYN